MNTHTTPPNTPKSLAGKTILVIEDDDAILRVYTKWLSRSGVHVLAAGDGASGLKILKDEKVDLVLLDLGMPGMNGYETLKKIREQESTKTTLVIILSNTTMNENRDGFTEIMELGVEAILRKYETSLKELIHSVQTCFEKKSHART